MATLPSTTAASLTLSNNQVTLRNKGKMIKRVPEGLFRLHKTCNTLRTRFLVTRRMQSAAAAPQPENPEDAEAKEKRLSDLRHKYPEFLPDPTLRVRNALREELEREDMMRRRRNLSIPEFYVGSVLAVTSADKHSPGKFIRFLGICIQRSEYGMRTTFLLRNIVQNEGVEVLYYLYSPLIHKIELIKLEKRLDNELLYLRDAPPEYSTFPFDMDPEYIDPNAEVPINTIKVPLNPRPWIQRYERMNFKGVILPELSEKIMKKAEAQRKPWEKYDLMDIYRKLVPEEEINNIFGKLQGELQTLEKKQKIEKRNKDFVKPQKQKLF